jgi:hypothetical protein
MIGVRTTTPAQRQEVSPMAAPDEPRWIVRLTPPAGQTVGDLLRLPLALDVWQREPGALVAAVPAATLRELERRRLAGVERLGTTEEHEVAAAKSAGGDPATER